MALALSIFTLLAMIYQLFLQRIHNEKSVKPLVQINLTDNGGLIYVHIQNNGLGPFIVQKLVFLKDEQIYYNITDCLELSPRLYQHVTINESVKKVVPPGTYMEVFSKQFDLSDAAAQMNDVRAQLAALKLTVEGLDIYDNHILIERDLIWFTK